VKLEHIGFPDFQKEVCRQIGPLLDSATAFLEIGGDMLSKPFSGQLASVVREIARSVANSMESVLILVFNGCADDAFRIARTMFESAVTIHYLEGHPESLKDYVDFLWVKRKRHHDDLLRFAPTQAEKVDPQQLEQMNAEYERVRPRFTDRKGRVRNAWCQVSVRAMAEEVRADSMYGGLYEFTSSITHTDVLGLVSGAGASDEIASVPSVMNIPLALQMGVFNYAMTLTAVNQIVGLTFGERLDEAFSQFKRASVAVVLR
jgi:hypothetical protein